MGVNEASPVAGLVKVIRAANAEANRRFMVMESFIVAREEDVVASSLANESGCCGEERTTREQ